MMAKIVDINDIIGKKFGRLTVISLSYINNYNYYYNCHCDCGNDIVRLMGLSQSKISLVCNGIRKQTGGFIWKFKQET